MVLLDDSIAVTSQWVLHMGSSGSHLAVSVPQARTYTAPTIHVLLQWGAKSIRPPLRYRLLFSWHKTTKRVDIRFTYLGYQNSKNYQGPGPA
jgi:hypothetical protein